MANIQARRNKEGQVISYSIRVYRGRDPQSGKQLTPFSHTWRVPEGWGEKRARREAEKQAVLFERQCRQDLVSGGRQTFAEYAEYVLICKTTMGMKHLTEIHYRQPEKGAASAGAHEAVRYQAPALKPAVSGAFLAGGQK